MTVPRRLLRDQVTVRPMSGRNAYGPVLGTAATVGCKASFTRQLVRNAEGEEVVSELTLYVHPDDAASFPVGSLVTFGAYSTTVLANAPMARPGETVLARVTCA